MKKIILTLFILSVFSLTGFFAFKLLLTENVDEKIYIAVEGDGKVAVIDPLKRKLIKNIDLSVKHDGGKMIYSPHNIQVAPDGSTVWVTANVSGHSSHSMKLISEAHAHVDGSGNGSNVHTEDEVVVIDPLKDEIVKRIPIEVGVHLAHVVLTPDSGFAYVTAQNDARVFKINTQDFRIERTINTPDNSEPHGIRIATNGSIGVVALLKGKSLGILDIKTDAISFENLEGQAVQSAITSDGKFAFASLYDSKKIAVYNIIQKSITYISLPETAKGPIQLYLTPDSKYLYVADQGYYFDQPQGQFVYKINVSEAKVVDEIRSGDAPHGVVVSKDGKFVYITNLVSGDVSVIDTASDQRIATIPVGKEPNGISIWSKENGGTP